MYAHIALQMLYAHEMHCQRLIIRISRKKKAHNKANRKYQK